MPDGTSGGERERWLSPAWVAAIASAVAALVAVFAFARDTGGGDESSAVDQPAQVFVYGTMKPGHRFYPEIDGFVAETSPDRVAGRLFDSGVGYPAAVFDEDSDQFIEGFVLRLVPERAEEANQIIADIESNLFRPVRVRTEGGVSAIAYEWVESTEDLDEIPSGIWDRANET